MLYEVITQNCQMEIVIVLIGENWIIGNITDVCRHTDIIGLVIPDVVVAEAVIRIGSTLNTDVVMGDNVGTDGRRIRRG